MSFTKVAGFRFYTDGTAEAVSITGKVTKPRAPVIDVQYGDTIRNKPAAGRLVGAVLSGGLNMLFSPGRDGGYQVMVLTTEWAKTWQGPASFAGTYRRLIEEAFLARARAAMG